VDHYGIDDRWESLVRTGMSKLMVIDDLADRKHMADLLLDQNVYPNMERRYDGLVRRHASGCSAPLRAGPSGIPGDTQAGLEAARTGTRASSRVPRGADAQDQTSKVLRALNLSRTGRDLSMLLLDPPIPTAQPSSNSAQRCRESGSTSKPRIWPSL